MCQIFKEWIVVDMRNASATISDRQGEYMNSVIYSKKSDEWETPEAVFRDLDNEFHFDLDPCATKDNHKCKRYFDKESNGLLQNWGGVRFSVIHHIAAYMNGCENAMKSPTNHIQWLSC